MDFEFIRQIGRKENDRSAWHPKLGGWGSLKSDEGEGKMFGE